MAEVAFVEKIGDSQICVVLKGSAPTKEDGYGRGDCPYLTGDEMQDFLKAWCYFRYEIERRDGEPNEPRD